MERWRDQPEMRVTVVALVGGLSLVATGTAGVAGSPLLAVALLVAAGAVYVLGGALAETGVGRSDRHGFLADLWLGPAVAAIVVALFLDASAGEVQALGGLLGLVGMVNYFLRPLYHMVLGLFSRLTA